MPIEFRCPQCEKLLRVPDESAGAKAKCPQCGAIEDVPQADAAAPNGESSSPFSGDAQSLHPAAKPAGDEPVNPYSPPAGGFPPSVAKPDLSADVGSIISYAWEVWKSNLGILLGITVIVFGVSIGFSIVQNMIIAVFEQQGESELGTLVSLPVVLLGNFVQIFLGIGQAQIVLKLLRGQPAEVGELFGGGPLFLRVLGASILAGLAMFVGVLACIVPGILLALFFWPFYWLIVDNKAGAIESFQMARPIAQEHVGTVVVLWLASAGIMVAGMLALCVGLLFAAPFVSLIWGAAYLSMSGQLSTRPPY